jgi:hypothetical protein
MRSTQAPPQVESPLGHPHAPFVHAWPPVHCVVQLPQWNGSVARFGQLLSFVHIPCVAEPVAHIATHEPDMQNGAVVGHTVPHAPQFFESESVYAHEEPHALSGAVQAHAPD